jgi:hypothetical protein
VPRLTFLRLINLLFVGIFFGVLALPLLTHHWRGDPGIWASEKRQASPFPPWPQSWQSILAWSKQADDYLADHFGGRTKMVMAFNRARYGLFGETPTEQTVFGEHGRLFLTSHSAANPYSLIGAICGVGVDDAALDRAAGDLEAFLRQATPWAADSYVMAVPTAPALYARDLPVWAQAQCTRATTMDRLMPRLPPGPMHDRLLYPLPAMMAAESRGDVIPLTNFHWEGLGARTAAVAFAEGRLGLTPRMTLPTRAETEPSDIEQMIPGIPTGNVVRLPDYAAVGADYCWGASCFPELGATAGTIYDLSRLRSPRAGDRKLLVFSDSFGTAIVGWFAPYFGSVWHFSVSNMSRMSGEERERFRQHVFIEYKPDVVLYLFHDGSVQYWPAAIAVPGLWAAAPVSAAQSASAPTADR